MNTTNNELRCLYCNTNVSAREINDGWCDSCGKKLPMSFKTEIRAGGAKAAHSGGNADVPTLGAAKWAVLAALVVVALAASVASVTLLTMS